MSSAARIIIASPANGFLVFDNDSNSFWFYDVGTQFGLSCVQEILNP
ncbi:MAG: hypothetical protein IPK25_16390 [Saprospiraceae bacterium]|nr:hypothetical protein [Saprospiraceae bacterium]MBK8854392.1 hypothetical protein [Saprospiraceae bacterium]